MKPLTEWTTEELRTFIAFVDNVQGAVSELLRRAESAMKERCAAECDAVGEEVDGKVEYEGSHWAYECGKRIRALP